jgi:hypothetical protein
MIKFIIVGHPRSGSSFLAAVLNQHPDVFCASEILHVTPDQDGAAYGRRILGGDSVSPSNLDEFLQKTARTERRSCIGFTLFDNRQHTLTDAEAASLVSRSNLRVILLIRQNLLKAFLSWKRGMESGLWHLDASGQPIIGADQKNGEIKVDYLLSEVSVDEAREWITRTKTFLDNVEQSLRRTRRDFVHMTYEDLCMRGDPHTLLQVNRILEFLGVPPLDSFEHRRRKIATRQAYQAIANREELIRVLGYELD